MATTLPPLDRIQNARSIIDRGLSGGYEIKPTVHASMYVGSAPQLAARLGQADVVVVAQQYETDDTLAMEAQTTFKALSTNARWAVFASGTAGALLVATGGLASTIGDGTAKVLMIACAVVGVGAGALAGKWISDIKNGKRLEAWMTRRAEAETRRNRIFDLVTRGKPLDEPLLQLEYFRRYQLDVQREYYGTKGEKHRAAGERSLSLTTSAMAASSIATGLAGVLSASLGKPFLTSIAALGVVSQAFATVQENQEATAQDRRNAERYERTRKTMDELAARLDDVRAATADGRIDVMHEFIGAVQEQISLEHRQWLEDSREKGEAVNKLEGLLKEYDERRKK